MEPTQVGVLKYTAASGFTACNACAGGVDKLAQAGLLEKEHLAVIASIPTAGFHGLLAVFAEASPSQEYAEIKEKAAQKRVSRQQFVGHRP